MSRLGLNRRLLREENGQSIVEFAFIIVPLVTLIVLVLQVGFYMQAKSSLREAVRAAARQASLCRSPLSKSPAQLFQQITASSMSNSAAATATFTPSSIGSSTGGCTLAPGTPVTVMGSSPWRLSVTSIFGVSISLPALSATAASTVE